jgi:hypothetical protein
MQHRIGWFQTRMLRAEKIVNSREKLAPAPPLDVRGEV